MPGWWSGEFQDPCYLQPTDTRRSCAQRLHYQKEDRNTARESSNIMRLPINYIRLPIESACWWLLIARLVCLWSKEGGREPNQVNRVHSKIEISPKPHWYAACVHPIGECEKTRHAPIAIRTINVWKMRGRDRMRVTNCTVWPHFSTQCHFWVNRL